MIANQLYIAVVSRIESFVSLLRYLLFAIIRIYKETRNDPPPRQCTNKILNYTFFSFSTTVGFTISLLNILQYVEKLVQFYELCICCICSYTDDILLQECLFLNFLSSKAHQICICCLSFYEMQLRKCLDWQ